MPLSYYARIYEYKVRVDETQAVYEDFKKLYQEEDEDEDENQGS